MHFQYPKPLRFALGERMKGRKYLSPAQQAALLSGNVLVEEKMDGRLVTFQAERFMLCAEDMKWRRAFPYRVPARFAVFDVYEIDLRLFFNGEGKRDVIGFFMRNPGLLPGYFSGIFPVTLIGRGTFSPDELPGLVGESKYVLPDAQGRRRMAGVIIKPDRELPPDERVCGRIDGNPPVPKRALVETGEGALNEIDSSLLEWQGVPSFHAQ